jgi:hypothetical protein
VATVAEELPSHRERHEIALERLKHVMRRYREAQRRGASKEELVGYQAEIDEARRTYTALQHDGG